MKTLDRHLNWNDWHLKHHIDHHLGRLTQRRYEMMDQSKSVDKESLAVYTPDRWLVGQRLLEALNVNYSEFTSAVT